MSRANELDYIVEPAMPPGDLGAKLTLGDEFRGEADWIFKMVAQRSYFSYSVGHVPAIAEPFLHVSPIPFPPTHQDAPEDRGAGQA